VRQLRHEPLRRRDLHAAVPAERRRHPAPRPVITTAPAGAAHGAAITVATDRPVASFAIVRMGTATHTVDTDQRRIALPPTTVSGGYRLTIPADAGVALPGYWMLFAMDAGGVPSVAKTIRIG
jgi:galactose oxidase